MNRREFLKWVGGGSGAVLAGCTRREPDKIVSYFDLPHPSWIPGKPITVRSTCMECPAHCGVEVKAYEKFENGVARMMPVKLEGAPGHPINGDSDGVNAVGRLCVRGQAGLTRLYQPDRLKGPLVRQGDKLQPAKWDEAIKKVREGLKAEKNKIWLSGRTSGTLSKLVGEFCAKFAVDRRPDYEVFHYAEIRKANGLVFGRDAVPHYRIDQADFLLTVGADILETFGSPVSNTIQLERARRRLRESGKPFPWVHVEPHLSLTGAKAGERLVVAPSSEAHLLAYLLRKQAGFRDLDPDVQAAVPDRKDAEVEQRTGLGKEELERLARRWNEARRPLLIAGGVSTMQDSGTTVAVLAALLQERRAPDLWDFSQAENYEGVGSLADVRKLVDDLLGGSIGAILLSRTNPVATLPLDFKGALQKATFKVAFTDFLDETSELCDVVLPVSHALESLGDAQPRRGVTTVVQPVITPLHDTRGEGEILLEIMQSLETYRGYLARAWGADLKTLETAGFVAKAQGLEPAAANPKNAVELLKAVHPAAEGLTLLQVPTVRWFDGRSKRLPLLNEIPDPLTTVTYGSWVSISPAHAMAKGLEDGDEVSLESAEWSGKLPAKIQPRLPDNVLTVARGLVAIPAMLRNVKLSKTGTRIPLPVLSGAAERGMSQDGRGLIPMGHGESHGHHPKAEGNGLYPEHKHHPYRWAMAIDLDACTGCGACVAACHVENNVPLVGATDHVKGREMSWIRIEPFYEKEGTGFLPMLCQHCDNAPCEPVCPVFASYHTTEGLNGQIYNRCVGTRYCSNNCPYKVRRFNWWDHPTKLPLVTMSNPETSLRGRGVMEKCTFCVQRIRTAKDHAKDEGRIVRDGEVTPACAQTCPANAIVFGNILDPDSRVHRLSQSKRGYTVFEELNTRPAVTYLRPEIQHES